MKIILDEKVKDVSIRADRAWSYELNLMSLLGPSRAFFSVQVIGKDGVTARQHSHSTVDKFYLILEGKGTLRYNGRETEAKRGDLISKTTGLDVTSHLVADKGEELRT